MSCFKDGTGRLHNHSTYSNSSLGFSDVLCSTKEIIQHSYDIGLRGIALTDHESLSGAVEALDYYNNMKLERPYTFALGNEVYIQTKQEFIDTRDNGAKVPFYHFILVALDTTGYRQLCELSTRAWMRGYKKRIWRRVTLTEDLIEIVKNNQGHMISSSACLSSRIDKLLLEESYEEAKKEALLMQDIFGKENFFLEVQPADREDSDQSIVNNRMKILSKETGIDIIPTTDTHYLKKEDRLAHKVYLNSSDGDREVDDFYSTTYMMDDEELRGFLHYNFNDEEIDKMFKISHDIFCRVGSYDIYHNPIIPKLPIEKIPPFIHDSNFFGYDLTNYPSLKFYSEVTDIHEQYFYYQLKQGFKKHILDTDKKKNVVTYLKRVETELTELKKISEALDTSMVCYYSTQSVMIDLMWECDSMVGPGRGSSAAFVITYLLDITTADPVPLGDYMCHWRHMSFERGAEIAD